MCVLAHIVTFAWKGREMKAECTENEANIEGAAKTMQEHESSILQKKPKGNDRTMKQQPVETE